MNESHILRRYENNPVLVADAFPKPINSVFNAGAVKWRDQYILLTRVEDLSGSSYLWAARSQDGFHFIPDAAPALLPAKEGTFADVEDCSIEDPRITQLEGSFYITYVGYSDHDCVSMVAKTEDFRSFERISILGLPENKDVVLFPEKIGGRYAKLDRPMTQTSQRGDMWISFSPDLVYWGDPRPVMQPRKRKWDCQKIGAGAPPIRTSEGWLVIYHGVRQTSAGSLYRLGAVLLDLEQPWQVIGRSDQAILSPISSEDYFGNVGNVVFTCGAILEENGELKVYYGAADQVVCCASAPVDDVIALCLEGRSGQG